MQIEKARSDDISALQGIARWVIQHNYTPFLGHDNVTGFIESGQSDKEIENGIEHCHVMWQSETIIGYTVFTEELLHIIMIDVPYQHKGYGAELLAYAEREMFKHNSLIKLQTFEKNTPTICFYEKKGWAKKGMEYIPTPSAIILTIPINMMYIYIVVFCFIGIDSNIIFSNNLLKAGLIQSNTISF